MKHTLCALPLLGIALSAWAQTPADPVALVKTVSGVVEIVRGDATRAAAPGATLQIADRLVAGPGASAGVTFKDGTLLTLGPSSEVLVRDFVFQPRESKYAFSVYLAKGSAIYASGKIGKMAPESVRVESPMATVGVRGTRFLISAE